MQIDFVHISVAAVAELKKRFGNTDIALLLRGEECPTCFSAPAQLEIMAKSMISVTQISGHSNGFTWVVDARQVEAVRDSEIDWVEDCQGGYFTMYNRGHYVCIEADAIEASASVAERSSS
jgi:Fe-S cluster assembly iron-binding protein IscA